LRAILRWPRSVGRADAVRRPRNPSNAASFNRIDHSTQEVLVLLCMKRRKKATSARVRERRARAVITAAEPGTIPKGMKFISFRKLTAPERAYGNSLAGRAAELLARKSEKVAVSR